MEEPLKCTIYDLEPTQARLPRERATGSDRLGGLPLQPERPGRGRPGSPGLVAAADQEGDEPAVSRLRWKVPKPPGPRLREPGEAIAVVAGCGFQRVVDERPVETLGREAGGDRATTLEPAVEGVLDELGREPDVVDEPDLLETVELGRDLVGREAGADQARRELAPGPLPNREQPKRTLVEGELAGGHGDQPAGAGSVVRSLAFARPADSSAMSDTIAIGWSASSANAVRPTASRTLRSISSATSVCSMRNCRAFSRPWPSCSPSYVNHAPLFFTISRSTPTSSRLPSLEIPRPYMMSNSHCRNGGATLFLTTLTRVREPTISVPSLRFSTLRTSSRTEE